MESLRYTLHYPVPAVIPAPPVSTKAHAPGPCFALPCVRVPGRRAAVQRKLGTPYRGPRRAVHVGGLQQLPAGGPLAAEPGREGLCPRARGAAFAARQLLGLHRLGGAPM